MKYVKKAIVLLLAMTLPCAASCGKKGKAAATVGTTVTTNQSTVDTVPAIPDTPNMPSLVPGVEEWEESGTQVPATTQPGQATQPGQTEQPTQPGQTEATTSSTGTAATQPGQTEQTTPPEQTQPGAMKLEDYKAMTTAQQQAYFNSFASVDAFYEWLDAAEADYEERHKNDTVTGDGTLDLGDYITKNP